MSSKSLKKVLNSIDFVLFTFPALFTVVIVTNIPFLLNLYYSLFNWDGISRNKEFVGLDNFIKIFTIDRAFKNSMFFTFRFTLLFVIIVNVTAIILAYVLAKNSKVCYVFRSFFFIPYIISMVAISLIWKSILGTGFTYLHENSGISFFGLSWLGTSNLAFYTTTAIAIWQNVGFYMIIYIAGFMAIPQDVMEAASIDGASRFVKFLKMQLPLLMPSITISIFTSLTFSFKLFDIILVLTQGGPAGSTTSIAYNIYNEAFFSKRYGLATSKSLVFFVIVLLITLIQLKWTKAREVEM